MKTILSLFRGWDGNSNFQLLWCVICHGRTLTEPICPYGWNVHSYCWNLISHNNIKRPSVSSLQNKPGYTLPSRLANMHGSCGWERGVFPSHWSLFSGVKGHPYADVLKIYGQMGPLRSKPLALFGLSWRWNIDGKIEIFCLLLNVAHLKGLMCVRTFLSLVTAKCSSTSSTNID